MNAKIVEIVGILKLKLYHTVNIKMKWRHPKYYKELRKRNKSDQVISETKPTGDGERAPDQGLKQQASSSKRVKQQATSLKPQA